MLENKNTFLAVTLFIRVFNAAGQIAIAFFLLKAYGEASVGFFTVFVSNTMLVSLLMRQGFDRTLILIGARNHLSKHTGHLFNFYFRAILLVSPLFGLINILVFVATSSTLSLGNLWFIIAALPIVFACSFLVAGLFTGLGKTVSAAIQQPGFSSGITSCILIFSYAFNVMPDVFLTYFLVACFVSISGIAKIYLNNSIETGSFLRSKNVLPTLLKKAAKLSSRRYLVINFFTTFNSVCFPTFLALFVTDSLIGEFKVVERLAMVIAFNLSFINIILPSKSINKFNVKDSSGFCKSIQYTFMFQYLTAGALFLAFLLFKEQLSTWLEIKNESLFYLLLIAQLINAFTGPVRVLLMYMGGQRILQFSAIVETIASMALYWSMYALYGLTGLAVSYFLAISIPNIILACIVFRRFGIIPLPIPQKRPLATNRQ